MARKLRGALGTQEEAESADGFSFTPVGAPLAGALLPVPPVDTLDDVVLPAAQRARLGEVLQEWRMQATLDAAGVARRTKLLLHGPSGCGKTLTARALGGEMSLPVFVVRFDGVVGSYLGQTAARLRQLFRYAETVPSVLVLDEIDALAQRRGNPRDVGELDRVVISLLQELEHSTPRGIIVASSTLPRALDDALWRRFDWVLDFPDAGKKEQARWALLREFRLPPIETRVDVAWLARLNAETAHEVIVEFQPVLSRADVDRLIEAIRQGLSETEGERVLGGGRDPSGRRRVRAQMRPQQIKRFASEFQSIQAIHAPLKATLFASPAGRPAGHPSAPSWPVDAGDLPVVAVVDAGVPREHPQLAAYRRGQYRHLDAEQTDPGDHGSRVASRVVFGDLERGSGFTPPPGSCRFLDVVVPALPNDRDELELDGKAIFESIRDVARTYSDVRVFNLSLGDYRPLGRLSENERQERLVEMQDLDNFAFEHDVVVVVAAGNTRPGVIPNVDYPGHVDDRDWALGAWAAGFNTLVVGGYVPRPNTDGVGRRLGWPSPFTRVGPGVAGAPVPGFSAGAGDCTQHYQWKAGLGVGTLNKSGDCEDAIGTSHAAPIVAREAALLLRELQKYCGPEALPFASTVKAFLRLVARPEPPGVRLPASVATLAGRTLGCGQPSAERLASPLRDTAVFLWQGTLEHPGHAARVRVPIPRDWLNRAAAPHVRVVCAWNTPTFAGAPKIWACRKVALQLRPTLVSAAPRAHGNAVGGYPLLDKTYDLGAEHLQKSGIQLTDDEWVLEAGPGSESDPGRLLDRPREGARSRVRGVRRFAPTRKPRDGCLRFRVGPRPRRPVGRSGNRATHAHREHTDQLAQVANRAAHGAARACPGGSSSAG